MKAYQALILMSHVSITGALVAQDRPGLLTALGIVCLLAGAALFGGSRGDL